MYSKYLLYKKIFLSNFGRLKLPFKLSFALTYKCNLKCKTCFIWKKEQKKELSVKEIGNFFKKTNYFSWIDLTGGEIFLRNDLSEIISIIFNYCRSLCIIHFPTNGQLTEKVVSIAEQVRKERKDINLVITVSMDGPEETNNRIRGNNESWRASLETFVELRRRRFKFSYLGYTLSNFNSGKLKDMLLAVKNYYPGIGFSDIHINMAHNSRHYFNNDLLCLDKNKFLAESAKEINDFLKTKKGVIKYFLERKYLELAFSYFILKQAQIRCKALSSTCFIDPYGDIYPCIIYDRKIANISDIDYDLRRIWNNDTVVLRKDILNMRCGGCWTPCEAYPAILGSLFSRELWFKKKVYFG